MAAALSNSPSLLFHSSSPRLLPIHGKSMTFAPTGLLPRGAILPRALSGFNSRAAFPAPPPREAGNGNAPATDNFNSAIRAAARPWKAFSIHEPHAMVRDNHRAGFAGRRRRRPPPSRRRNPEPAPLETPGRSGPRSLPTLFYGF